MEPRRKRQLFDPNNLITKIKKANANRDAYEKVKMERALKRFKFPSTV